MAKEDVTFTIGADGRAMAGELGKIAAKTKDALADIVQMFFGLQGVAAGLKTVFGGISGKAAEVENVAASLQRFLILDFECWMLNLC